MYSAIRVAWHLVDKANKASIDKANEMNIDDLTPLKLTKLTYIAHGWMLGLFDRPLFSEDVEAWKYGPVIPELYRETKQYAPQRHITATTLPKEYKIDNLSEEEEDIMDDVIEIYGELPSARLIEITHAKGTPWYNVTDGGRKIWPGIIISNEDIKNYYKSLQDHER